MTSMVRRCRRCGAWRHQQVRHVCPSRPGTPVSAGLLADTDPASTSSALEAALGWLLLPCSECRCSPNSRTLPDPACPGLTMDGCLVAARLRAHTELEHVGVLAPWTTRLQLRAAVARIIALVPDPAVSTAWESLTDLLERRLLPTDVDTRAAAVPA